MTASDDGDSLANVSRFLDAMGARHGEGAALKVPKGREGNGRIDYLELTFKELVAEQDAWGRLLMKRGIKKGTRVLLMVRPGLPLIALSFALFKLGAVPVLIDPGMGLKGFLSCVRRSRPEALVGIPLAIWVSRLFWLSFRAVRIRLRVGGPLTRAPRPNGAQSLESATTVRSDLAAILFTSGSTGAPKGVRYEHGMFESQVEAIRSNYNIQPGEIDLPMLPIFALFNPALGMTTVVPEINPSKPASVDPEKIVQAIRQCGVTNSFGSPVLWKKIGSYCKAHDIRLPSLKRILMAGASAPPSLMEQFRGILGEGHTHSPYGATEALPVTSIRDDEVLEYSATLTASGRGTCVGKPLPGVEVKIIEVRDDAVDATALETCCEQGEVGEIVATGSSVTREYDQLPEATRRAKIQQGKRVWHRMGDLGYFDSEGRLWFCGRMVERVESDGSRYLTDCCEGVFNSLPNVNRTALIGFVENGKTIPALVVEPVKTAFPRTETERARFIAGLQKKGAESEVTKEIGRFFFERSFPVDVRHNAKIHRLELAKRINNNR